MQRTGARVRLAQSRARQLVAEHRLARPIDVRRLARILKADVREAQFSKKDQVSGAIMRTPAGVVIVVNEDHYEVRKRFTIAHELGHLTLHDVKMHIDKARFRDDVAGRGVDPEEVEANAFAAELLMPVTLLREALKDTEVMVVDEELVDQLAEEFQVSSQAMSWRLSNLGFLR